MSSKPRRIGVLLKSILRVVLIGLGCALTTAALANTKTVSVQRFGSVQVVSPASQPTAFVILLSDPNDETSSSSAIAGQLASRGAAVAIINSGVMRSVLSSDEEGKQCVRLFGDIEELARLAERAIDIQSWLPPVFFGIGKGGTLAYLSLAQGPPNSVAGVVSLGYSPTLASKVPFCSDAPITRGEAGQFVYSPIRIPGHWTVFVHALSDPGLKPFLDANPGANAQVGSPGDTASLGAAIKSVFDMTAMEISASISDLPLTELPAKSPKGLAIFFSGDGGWRDIDKQIGETLSEAGIAVIGVDALRYFWNKKDPATIAADIKRILDHYGQAWQVTNFALIGYSFGAAVIPLAWPTLDPEVQKRIKSVVLLAPEPVGRLQMSMSGWLGIRSSDDIGLGPYLAQIPANRIMCIYSIEEQKDGTTGCTLPELDGATRVERAGGHHFGGAYHELAQLIRHRLTSPTPEL